MYNYEYSNELYHYGVKGMKWGVIRSSKELRSDRRTARKMKRHLAADKKNLRIKGKMHDKDMENYDEADKNYRKQLSKPSLSASKKRERIEEASKALTKAGDTMTKSRSDLNRAERIYDADEKKYRNHIDSMVKKYGSESVKNISTKDYNVGKTHVKEMIKTGVTLADLPIVGSYYSGRYVGGKEYDDRIKTIDKVADSRY